MNAQLPPHTGDLTPALPVPVTDLEHHLHRALAQLLEVLYFRCAGMALILSKGSEPPRSPVRSSDQERCESQCNEDEQ